MSNRNRNEGNGWERSILNSWLKAIFPNAVTARSESRRRDAAKVDFCFTGGWNIQAKSEAKGVNYHKLLNIMPDDGHNIIIHKRTIKKGTQFYDAGHYAIMSEEVFKILLTSYEVNNHTEVKKVGVRFNKPE